ncbi:MAG TPA: hypothetical protein VMV15_07705 [Candidatus Binataceae bacterium]|nr:hypothetical protein [Candidatus Binataceae bacterium]
MALFAPSRVAVVPPQETAAGRLFVGQVFDPAGQAERLFIDNPRAVVSRVVADALNHAGLNATITPGGPPEDIDYVVSCAPEQLTVVKRVATENSPGENSFVMEATARLKCSLASWRGKVIESGSFTGVENEPPLGARSGRPIVSDPAEALSAAIGDAVNAFVNQQDFRQNLPAHTTASFNIPANEPRATPSATPTPG